MCATYEYQCRVQVLIVLLHKFLVVFPGLLPVLFVEFGAVILSG